MRNIWICCLLVFCSFGKLKATDFRCESPNKSLEVRLEVGEGKGIVFDIWKNGQRILGPFQYGFVVDSIDLGKNIEAGRAEYAVRDTRIPYCGAQSILEEHFKQLRVPIFHKDTDFSYILSFKAFDTGIAFRVNMPLRSVHVFGGEYVELVIPASASYFLGENSQSFASVDDTLSLPFLMQAPGSDQLIAWGEVIENDFPNSLLTRHAKGKWKQVHPFNYKNWEIEEELISPWRFFQIGKDANRFSDDPLAWKLSVPRSEKLKDAPWIKEGIGLVLDTKEFLPAQIFDAKEWGANHVLLPAEEGMPSQALLGEAGRSARTNKMKLWAAFDAMKIAERSKRMANFIQMKQRGVSGIYLTNLGEDSLAHKARRDLIKDAELMGFMVFLEQKNSLPGFGRHTPHVMASQAPGIPGKNWNSGSGKTPSAFLGEEVLRNARLYFWENQPLNSDIQWPKEFLANLPYCWDETKTLPAHRTGKLTALARRTHDTWYIVLQNHTSQELSFSFQSKALVNSYVKLFSYADDPIAKNTLRKEERIIGGAENLDLRMGPGAAYVLKLVPVKLPSTSISSNTEGQKWKPNAQVSFQAEGTIHFTIDGTLPSKLSPVYDGSIMLEGPALVQAAIFGPEGQRIALKQVRFVE